MNEITNKMVEAARKAAYDVDIQLPFMARVGDYVSEGSEGGEREAQLAALRSADEEAERMNDEAIRTVIRAALDAR